jgi:protein-S-isoprenylcysteine O-methyltransferase Ste14
MRRQGTLILIPTIAMNTETIFRALFILAVIAMVVIRVFYQSRVLRDQRRVEIREGIVSLVAGSIAALTTIVFGAEYILAPGVFSFAYVVRYPAWLRALGALLLAGGIALLAFSHHHLGRSFHSLVVSKEDQVLVETGPYRWVRHPIYTAYLINYVGGGLLAGNLILTVAPVSAYAILVALRMGKEEAVMRERFGQAYIAYQGQTGRLCPRLRKRG